MLAQVTTLAWIRSLAQESNAMGQPKKKKKKGGGGGEGIEGASVLLIIT